MTGPLHNKGVVTRVTTFKKALSLRGLCHLTLSFMECLIASPHFPSRGLLPPSFRGTHISAPRFHSLSSGDSKPHQEQC